jgi:hypothetical protein
MLFFNHEAEFYQCLAYAPWRSFELLILLHDIIIWLNLSSMTGEQIQAPSSPRDGEDVAITIGRPKVFFHFNIFCRLFENSSLCF